MISVKWVRKLRKPNFCGVAKPAGGTAAAGSVENWCHVSSWAVRKWLNSFRQEFWKPDKFQCVLTASKSRKGLVSHVSGQLDIFITSMMSSNIFSESNICWVAIQKCNLLICIKSFYHLKIDFWRSTLVPLCFGGSFGKQILS